MLSDTISGKNESVLFDYIADWFFRTIGRIALPDTGH